MTFALSRTAPFRRLQARIGSATYRLNTIFVGLELVADGGAKPVRFAVSWKKPPTLEVARQVVDQAKTFACAAALALASDVFDGFIREISREEWLTFATDARDIATRAKTRSKEQGGDYSVCERLGALLSDLGLEHGPALAAIDLFSKWRNIVAHQSERPVTLADWARELLLKSKDHFYEHYSHLDIALAIKNFEARNVPVSKEVTSLIALVQNVSRKIDETAIKRVAGSADAAEAVADKLLRRYFENLGRKQTAWAEVCDTWQGPEKRRETGVIKLLERIGFSRTTKPVSAALSPNYLQGLVRSNRDDIAHRFAVERRGN